MDIDSYLLLLINGAHTEYLDHFMWHISGKFEWIPFYIVTLLAIYRLRGWQGVLHILLMVGIMMIFTDAILNSVIRPWIGRLRPANLDNPISQYVHIVNDYRGGTYGCPSAHAANDWGLYLLIAYFLRSRKIFFACIPVVLLICYSRSYLGVHYPGDLLLGIIYSSIVVGTLIYLHRKHLPEKYAPPIPVQSGSTALLPIITTYATILILALISAFSL